MFGAYLVFGILIIALLLALGAGIGPKLKKYRLVIKKIEPRKKRHVKAKSRKRKSIWIKVI